MSPNIPGNVTKNSGECPQRFSGMLPNIPENAAKHSGECPQVFRGMSVSLKGMRTHGQSKISWNLQYRIFHGICGRRLINSEAVEAQSSYKKSYVW